VGHFNLSFGWKYLTTTLHEDLRAHLRVSRSVFNSYRKENCFEEKYRNMKHTFYVPRTFSMSLFFFANGSTALSWALASYFSL
jgi:hypothetical protein